ncbi:uncharacterized protein LOC144435856 [Glandiceps talaboti]
MRSRISPHEAAFTGEVGELKTALDSGVDPNTRDPFGFTLIHRAGMNGALNCIQLLVERGAQVNTTDLTGQTALHYAAANGYLEVVKWLTQKGHASTSAKTHKGHTPRFMAKTRGQGRVVTFLNELENKMEGNTLIGT